MDILILLLAGGFLLFVLLILIVAPIGYLLSLYDEHKAVEVGKVTKPALTEPIIELRRLGAKYKATK